MEISAEKTKLMTKNTSGINKHIKVNEQKLETVTSFKYQACNTLKDSTDNSSTDKLRPVWNDSSISLSSKKQLMRYLVTSIFFYACESCTLTAELQILIQAMEMRCYRKILRISYRDHVTNEEVCAKIQQAIGSHEDLLTIVKRRKLRLYGHVSRSSGLTKTILQRHSERRKKTRRTEKEVGRHQEMDRPKVRQVPEGSGEQEKIEKTGYEIICGAPTTLSVKG